MFNYECYKQKGTVLGTCIDGFLFGACCRLPSKDSDISENTINVDKLEVSSEKPISSTSHHKFTPPTFLSDILKSRTSTQASIEDSAKTNTSQNNNTVDSSESSIFIDNLDMQLPIKQPSIILGNGSVVSLESISIKPELYDIRSEKPSTTPDRNQLFTWFAIDQLMNSTTAKESSSEPTTTTSSIPSTTTTAENTLPFLEDLDFFSIELDPTKKSTTEKKTTSTTKTSTTTTKSTSLVPTTKEPTTTDTTITDQPNQSKFTTHPIWPDPFLDLATAEHDTLRLDNNQPI